MQRVHSVLKPGGKAIFLETNAENPILMFCRRYLAGRFGILRMGTDDEYPMTADEFALIGRIFPDHCCIRYPNLRFFEQLGHHVFRRKIPPIRWLLKGMDRAIYTCLPPLRKYGYDVLIEVVKSESP